MLCGICTTSLVRIMPTGHKSEQRERARAREPQGPEFESHYHEKNVEPEQGRRGEAREAEEARTRPTRNVAWMGSGTQIPVRIARHAVHPRRHTAAAIAAASRRRARERKEEEEEAEPI